MKEIDGMHIYIYMMNDRYIPELCVCVCVLWWAYYIGKPVKPVCMCVCGCDILHVLSYYYFGPSSSSSSSSSSTSSSSSSWRP